MELRVGLCATGANDHVPDRPNNRVTAASHLLGVYGKPRHLFPREALQADVWWSWISTGGSTRETYAAAKNALLLLTWPWMLGCPLSALPPAAPCPTPRGPSSSVLLRRFYRATPPSRGEARAARGARGLAALPLHLLPTCRPAGGTLSGASRSFPCRAAAVDGSGDGAREIATTAFQRRQDEGGASLGPGRKDIRRARD